MLSCRTNGYSNVLRGIFAPSRQEDQHSQKTNCEQIAVNAKNLWHTNFTCYAVGQPFHYGHDAIKSLEERHREVIDCLNLISPLRSRNVPALGRVHTNIRKDNRWLAVTNDSRYQMVSNIDGIKLKEGDK